MAGQLVKVATYGTAEEAVVARIALEFQGIEATIKDDTVIGLLWHMGIAMGGVKLFVPEADAARARQILANDDGESPADPRDTICGECGAAIESGFDICWSCGAPVAEAEAAADLPVETATVVAPRAKVSAPESDVESPVPGGDAMATRAFRAAVIGCFVCPPLLHVYSVVLLWHLGFSGEPLSAGGRRQVYAAWAIDILAALSIGIFVARWLVAALLELSAT